MRIFRNTKLGHVKLVMECQTCGELLLLGSVDVICTLTAAGLQTRAVELGFKKPRF